MGRGDRDLRGMHADQQMAFAIDILQPPIDQIISGLEVQPGERFIDSEEIDLSRPGDDFVPAASGVARGRVG